MNARPNTRKNSFGHLNYGKSIWNSGRLITGLLRGVLILKVQTGSSPAKVQRRFYSSLQTNKCTMRPSGINRLGKYSTENPVYISI